MKKMAVLSQHEIFSFPVVNDSAQEMFNRLLAAVGIGGATVDTKFNTTTFQPGDQLTAKVVVTGGRASQKISQLSLSLEASFDQSMLNSGSTKTIKNWPISKTPTIKKGKQGAIPITETIHPEIPVTDIGSERVLDIWVTTEMAIRRGRSTAKTQPLSIKPSPQMTATLKAIKKSGFGLTDIRIRPKRIRFDGLNADLGLDQAFVFEPVNISTKAKELSVHFLPRNDRTPVLLEFDFGDQDRQRESLVIHNDNYSEKSVRDEFESLLMSVGCV